MGGDRAIGALRDANEVFFHLDGRRVLYDAPEACLYFIDVPGSPVLPTLRCMLAVGAVSLTIEQLHLDAHRLFPGACRVSLPADRVPAVLAALRLVGLHTTIRQPRD
jgi:hypothetical protein